MSYRPIIIEDKFFGAEILMTPLQIEILRNALEAYIENDNIKCSEKIVIKSILSDIKEEK